MSVTQCPACLGANISEPLQRLTGDQVAEYFIPKARSRSRHDALLTVLRRLWEGAEVVDIRKCLDCGLGFAVPFVGGDLTFYEVVYEGASGYPAHRWEFRRTLQTLDKVKWPNDTISLLEAG